MTFTLVVKAEPKDPDDTEFEARAMSLTRDYLRLLAVTSTLTQAEFSGEQSGKVELGGEI